MTPKRSLAATSTNEFQLMSQKFSKSIEDIITFGVSVDTAKPRLQFSPSVQGDPHVYRKLIVKLDTISDECVKKFLDFEDLQEYLYQLLEKEDLPEVLKPKQ